MHYAWVNKVSSALFKYQLNADEVLDPSLYGSHGSCLDSIIAWDSSHHWVFCVYLAIA